MPDEEKPHRCEKCGTRFRSARALVLHTKRHDRELRELYRAQKDAAKRD